MMNTAESEKLRRICDEVWRDRAGILADSGVLSGETALLRAATVEAMDDERDVRRALGPDREGLGATALQAPLTPTSRHRTISRTVNRTI